MTEPMSQTGKETNAKYKYLPQHYALTILQPPPAPRTHRLCSLFNSKHNPERLQSHSPCIQEKKPDQARCLGVAQHTRPHPTTKNTRLTSKIRQVCLNASLSSPACSVAGSCEKSPSLNTSSSARCLPSPELHGRPLCRYVAQITGPHVHNGRGAPADPPTHFPLLAQNLVYLTEHVFRVRAS